MCLSGSGAPLEANNAVCGADQVLKRATLGVIQGCSAGHLRSKRPMPVHLRVHPRNQFAFQTQRLAGGELATHVKEFGACGKKGAEFAFPHIPAAMHEGFAKEFVPLDNGMALEEMVTRVVQSLGSIDRAWFGSETSRLLHNSGQLRQLL